MQTTMSISRNAIKSVILIPIALLMAGAWFIAIPLGGGDYLEQVRSSRSQAQRNVTQYLTRVAVGPMQESIEVLYAPASYFQKIGRDPIFVPRTKAGEMALVFYLSQTSHYNDLRNEPIKPILRVDGERAALPVEANILADSVHHRTTLLLYPLRDKAGRALITDQARQVELILPDVDGVPVGQNRVTWDLPIVYPDGLGTSDAFSFMALLALAAGLMTALSPCLLQQTVYYLSTMTGLAVYETNRRQRMHSARLVPTALAFVVGFTAIYTTAGAIAGAAGQAVRSLDVLTTWNRPIAFASGVMLIGMALWLAVRARAPVVCHLPFPEAMRNGKRFGLFGTMLMGAGIALGCVTCFGGAVFAALMFYLGSTGSAVQGAVAMFIFSIGVAVPYLLSAVAFSRVASLLERIQGVTPYLALGSAAVVLFFGIVMITGNFHTLSNGVYRMFPWF